VPTRILVVDDDPSIRLLVGSWLEREEITVELLPDARALFDALGHGQVDAICLDIQLPDANGVEVLADIRRRRPNVPVLMLTAVDQVATAVACMRLGAADYLVKPLTRPSLLSSVRTSMSMAPPTASEPPSGDEFGMIGDSPGITDVLDQVARVAQGTISVLLLGESGTGKELVARAIHRSSKRRDGPFVAINCGAIPESLQESELFGHEKGAFTGAGQRRHGRFEQAQGGTIFLDEVGELSATTQVRLLRVLQERELQRVGGDETVELDVRVVSATHRDLRASVEAGSFRADLYYRLAVYPISIPPLREREEDIDALTRHFIEKHRSDAASEVVDIEDDAAAVLRASPWPGNVRELENVIHAALFRSRGTSLQIQDLPSDLISTLGTSPSRAHTPRTLEDAERSAIAAAVDAASGNLSEAAKILGVARATLYRKMDRLGLRRP
jgi:two-component system response regulator HydG